MQKTIKKNPPKKTKTTTHKHAHTICQCEVIALYQYSDVHQYEFDCGWFNLQFSDNKVDHRQIDRFKVLLGNMIANKKVRRKTHLE